MARLRNLVFRLRPTSLDRCGLATALREHAGGLFDGEVSFSIDDRLRSDLRSETRTIAYRVAREALVNVKKHASASRVTITLHEAARFAVIVVHDDGAG